MDTPRIAPRPAGLLLAAAGLLPAAAAAELPAPAPFEPEACGAPAAAPAGGSGELELEADELSRDGDRLRLRGNARLRRGAWRGAAERVAIDAERERAVLEGDARLSGPGARLEAPRAEFDYGTGEAELVDARYRAGNAAGRAARLVRRADGALRIEDASYTACAPADPAWRLEAEAIEIDPAAGEGEARGAVLHLGGAPVLALPWLAFPVGDARRSGWLTPELGASDGLGYSLALPYYFNLAPHYDLTLTPRYMRRRGPMLEARGRYRTRTGGGELRGGLVDDREADDERHLLHWRHRAQAADGRWDARVRYTHVSDRDYLSDFASGLRGESSTRLRQAARAAWRGADWRAELGVAGSAPLGDHGETWDRLPRARARAELLWRGLVVAPEYAGDAFRGDAPEVAVEGERHMLGVGVARPVRGAGWELTPRVRFRHTRYRLRPAGSGAEIAERSPTRTTRTASLDARARFERRTAAGALHTLEPRLFYLNRPRRDESALPRFDSRAREPDYAALFREDRHAGLDRAPAADQLAAGVVTRLHDPVTGYLKLQAQLGRVWHFRDPDPEDPGRPAHSAWAGQIDYRPAPAWLLRVGLRHDPGRAGADTPWVSHLLRWRAGERQAQLRYLRRAGELEQAAAHALLPLGGGWRLAARYRYDLRAERDLELLAALEYRGCCMTVGLGAWKVRRDDPRPGEDSETRVLLQLRLHGLAGFGENPARRLRQELDGLPAWPH